MSVGKPGFLTWPVLLTPRVQAGAAARGAGGAPRVPPPQDRQPRPRHPQVSASSVVVQQVVQLKALVSPSITS